MEGLVKYWKSLFGSVGFCEWGIDLVPKRLVQLVCLITL